MKAILDTSFFFYDLPLNGELYTTPSVCSELVDIRSKGQFEKFSAAGLRVASPGKESLAKIDEVAKKTGDASVISGTDRDVLALALEMGAVLYTDDFAIQNVASRLGITIVPMQQRKAKRVRWRYRCSGCGRYYGHDGECPVCGSALKRKLK